jgi:uncharacterized protein YciI
MTDMPRTQSVAADIQQDAAAEIYVLRNYHTTPIPEVRHVFPAHMLWIEDNLKSGTFLLAGPQEPRVGGLIITRVRDRAELQKVVAADPFGDAVAYEITQVHATRFAQELEPLLVVPTAGVNQGESRPAPFEQDG